MDAVVDFGVGRFMALACVEPLVETANLRASQLAALWKVPLRAEFAGSKGVKAVVSESALGLGFLDVKKGKPFYVDFLNLQWKTRLLKGLPKSHIFRRALGDAERVIDATAGFGGDAVLALSIGSEVIAVERSAVVAAAFRDGVERAREDESLRARFAKLKIVDADALEFLAGAERAEAVYLDPMFEKPKSSAKSPKEMQLLQELLAPLPSFEETERLFTLAWERTLSRVVVKRPLKGKALGRTPSHSYKGQSIRYDVYVK